MGKSKKNREKQSKAPKKPLTLQSKTTALVNQALREPKTNGTPIAKPLEDKTVAQKEDEYLFHGILVSPIVVGAVVASKFSSSQFQAPAFGSFICVLGAANLYLQVIAKKEATFLWQASFALLAALLLLASYTFVPYIPIVLLLALSGILFYAIQVLVVASVRQVLLLTSAIVLEMGLLAFLGMASQFPDQVVLQAGFLGVFPGLLLAGSMVARYAQLLEKHGWRRSFIAQNRKGNEYSRPGLVSTLYSGLVLVVPAVFVALPLYQILPMPFMAAVLPLIPIPAICSEFLERRRPDEIIARLSLRLAFVMSVLMLAIGYLSVR